MQLNKTLKEKTDGFEFREKSLLMAVDRSDLADWFDDSRENIQELATCAFEGETPDWWDFESSMKWNNDRYGSAKYYVTPEQTERIKSIVLKANPNATEEDWEDYVDDVDELADAFANADRFAQQSGAESEMHKLFWDALPG